MKTFWQETMFAKDHRPKRETDRRTLGNPIRAAGLKDGQRKRIKSGPKKS